MISFYIITNKTKCKKSNTIINALNIVEMILNQVRCQHELITPHIKTLSSSSNGSLHEKMANVQCSFLFCVPNVLVFSEGRRFDSVSETLSTLPAIITHGILTSTEPHKLLI